MKDLEAMTRDFAHRLKRNFAHEITQDAKEFKKRVLQFVRRELPPRRGRPYDPRLDAAARMVANGRSLREVLRAQVPGFERLDTYARYLAEKGLRSPETRSSGLWSGWPRRTEIGAIGESKEHWLI